MTELRLCIFSRNFAEEMLVSSHCIPPAGSVSIYLITGAVYIGVLVKVMSAKLPQHRSRFGEIRHHISVSRPSSTFPFIHRLTYIYLNSWTLSWWDITLGCCHLMLGLCQRWSHIQLGFSCLLDISLSFFDTWFTF